MRTYRNDNRKEMLRKSFGSDMSLLHDIDFEDVALSIEALRMVRAAAVELCRRYMPAVDHERMTYSQCVGVFLDHCFWSEETGRLILCADIAQRSVCLPIPEEHWMVRDTIDVLH